ncbi:uncharacterized protein TNCV_2910151 [Trichonephila clavipes]|nr:uncharacterized protein TNCV_2910151 [Trichonephila clavipes]
MTLHSLTENSLAVLNHKILEANSQVQNVKLGGHQTCLSINRLWHELCDMLRRLVGTTTPRHHDCSIQERRILLAIVIISKLAGLGQRKQVCLQRIPSLVGVPGNSDELGGRGCDFPDPSSSVT